MGGIFRQTARVSTSNWVRWLRAGLIWLGVVGAVACADQRPPRTDLSDNPLEPEVIEGDAGDRTCYREGCACKPEGDTRACGTVKKEIAGYLWCSVGTQVCEGGVWSACETERVALRKRARSLNLQALGDSRSCVEENPCSPGCHLFEDTSGDLPVEPVSGLVDSPEGLTLAEAPNVPGGSCTSIELTPTTAQITLRQLDSFTPTSVAFTAQLVPEGCGGEVNVVFSVDRPDIAAISSDGVMTLRAPVAGPVEVSAFAGRLAAQATVNVKVDIADVSQAPAGTANHFDGQGDAEDELFTWLYPYSGTVFPPNVKPPLLQWHSVVSAQAVWNGGCALRADGSVRCWGINFNGDIQDQAGPYVQLSGRYAHFCALTPDGDAHCWGDNGYGQAENQTGPFVGVEVGARHSCGLRPDGAVHCWGRNNYGQLDVPADARFTAISAGAYTTCGVQVNGGVACWGNVSVGQDAVPQGTFIDVAAGTDHVCAIRSNRSLACWGSNASGQTQAPAGAFVSLEAATYHTCALRTDGAAVCWGQNQLGQGGIRSGPFVSVTAAGQHSCGVTRRGGVECWGDGSQSRAVGIQGGAVKVGLRYPATGEPAFEWSTIVPENQGDFADAPGTSVPLPPAPRARIPDNVWTALATAARGQAVALTVQRHTGDRLLRLVERTVHFSDSPLLGTITYQAYGTRRVLNATGIYEDGVERWGAVVFSYDAKQRTNAVLSGTNSVEDEWGTSPGCRGCHTVNSTGQTMIAGFHLDGAGSRYSLSRPNDGRLIQRAPREWEGTVWSALHPTLPIAFTSRGPSPCVSRISERDGSCLADAFTSLTNDLQGRGHVMQVAPGGMMGAGWLDSNGDDVFDSPAPSQIINLSGNPGAILPSSLPEGLRAAMPVFSPEGDRVVFVHYAGSVEDGLGTVHVGDRRSLAMVDFDSDGYRLQNFQRLTNEPAEPCDQRFDSTQPCSDVWPAFMPNGAGVVFQRQVFANGSIPGTSNSDFGGTRSGCGLPGSPACDDGAKGELWWVPLDSDGQPAGTFALNQANGVVSPEHLVLPALHSDSPRGHSADVEPLLNYQPSVAPRAVGQHTWMAFTSRRAYGNLATGNPWWSDPRVHPLRHAIPTKKVWISAIDAQAESGDPSAPAFYLEGQEVRSANGRPVWVGAQCIQPSTQRSNATLCESDADCCGAPETARCEVELPLGTSIRRHCMPIDASQCVTADAPIACQSDEQCCGFEEGERCASGRCVMPPALARYEAATFVRDYQASCPDGTLPNWKFLEWQAELPAGTSIDFTAATAPTQAELEDATAVRLATARPPSTTTWTTWWPEDSESIDDKLAAEGYPTRQWLRVAMTLRPDSASVQAPTLTDWRLIYDCTDGL
jgi:hypothetical protein